MDVRIIFDNQAKNRRFSMGWGFSCLVDKGILFDTGEREDYLFNNMGIMNIDFSSIKTVVISHDHWDHTGGLWGILNKRKGLDVYACPHFSRGFKDKVKDLQGKFIESEKFSEIAENIFVTGEIFRLGHIPEQALVVKTENGLTVITGCAHPGIVRILKRVKDEFPQENIYAVFGGFHLMGKDKREIGLIVEEFRKMGVQKAGPTHCSGEKAQEIFKEKYEDNYIAVAMGQRIKV